MLKKCAQQHFSTKFQCPSSQVFLQRRKLHVFGIETSCDDTAAAIVNDLGIVSECKITHGEIVAKHGGVFPNAMAEAQKQTIDHVIQETILHAQDANIMHKLDAIAVTCGPGLPPCLKQGILAAKALATKYNKPIIPIHHLEGHILLPRMLHASIAFPFLTLLISGGHCFTAIAHGIGDYQILGSSQDDSIGEAFDKVARLLNLDLTLGGGPMLEQHAANGDSTVFKFTVPMAQNKTGMDFSFSGLKSSVLRKVRELEHSETNAKKLDDIVHAEKNRAHTRSNLPSKVTADLAAAFQVTACKHLIQKTQVALQYCKANHPQVNTLVITGGSAANLLIRHELSELAAKHDFSCQFPPVRLCTDNGVMIAWAGVERLKAKLQNIKTVDIHQTWSLTELKQ